jgi:CheY-like chemotaxis protein
VFLKGITVAMADDSSQQLSRNQAVCIKYGMTILGSYTNGEDLYNAIVNGLKPEVVLLDIVMKGMTGIETTQMLRGRGFINKIILVTSMGQKNTSDPKKVGADYLLIKPFPDEWFLTAVLSVMRDQEVPQGIENPSDTPTPLDPADDGV